MIKVPATPGGLAALEELSAGGVTLNVTLIFSDRQYDAAREAIWRGAQRRKSLESVQVGLQHFRQPHRRLHEAARAAVVAAGAGSRWGSSTSSGSGRRIRRTGETRSCRSSRKSSLPAPARKTRKSPPTSTSPRLAGSDIQTNPPATNAAIQEMKEKVVHAHGRSMPPADVLAEIDREVDFAKMEEVLMDEGLKKFADPQKALLKLIGEKREDLPRRRI